MLPVSCVKEKSRKKKNQRVKNVYFHCQAFSEGCGTQRAHFCTCKMKNSGSLFDAPNDFPWVSLCQGAQGTMLASVICIIVVPFSFAFIAMVTSNSSENSALSKTAWCDLGQFVLAKEGSGIRKVGDFPLALQFWSPHPEGPEKVKDRGERNFFSPPIYRGETISRF